MNDLLKIYSYMEKHRSEFIKDVQTYLRQPSVSSTGEGIKKCAEMTLKIIRDLDAEGKIVPLAEGKGSPVVLGEIYALKEREEKKTLLVYFMYDVQPVEPLEEWISPPWEANMVDDKIIARGAINTKGPTMAFLEAIKSIKAVTRDLPVNLLLLFEGEEELGSPNLPEFVKKYENKLKKADALYMQGTGPVGDETVTISLGAKGCIDLTLETSYYEKSIHSSNGAIIDNPAWRLLWALNSMKNERDEITIEGFYDDVKPPSEKDLELLKKLLAQGFEDVLKAKLGEVGVRKFRKGLSGIDLLKEFYFQPVLNFDGFSTGYTGPGINNIVPARAIAKVDIRLVADQNPDDILSKVRTRLHRRGFDDVKVTKATGSMVPASRAPPDTDIVKAAIETSRRMGYEPMVFPTSAGTAPWYLFVNPPLRLPMAMLGGTGPSGRAHAPNEYITTEEYMATIKMSATFMYEYASLAKHTQ